MVNYLSIIIPCYNEVKYGDIKLKLNKLYSFLDINVDNFEIILVNDGSTDRTAENLILFSAGKQYARVVSDCRHRGLCDAIKLGTNKSIYENVLVLDSKLDYDFNFIRSLVNKPLRNKVYYGYSERTFTRHDALILKRLSSNLSLDLSDYMVKALYSNQFVLKNTLYPSQVKDGFCSVEFLYLCSKLNISNEPFKITCDTLVNQKCNITKGMRVISKSTKKYGDWLNNELTNLKF